MQLCILTFSILLTLTVSFQNALKHLQNCIKLCKKGPKWFCGWALPQTLPRSTTLPQTSQLAGGGMNALSSALWTSAHDVSASGIGGFEGLGGVRASSPSAAVYHPPPPSCMRTILRGFLRFAWTPLGSSGGSGPLDPPPLPSPDSYAAGLSK